MGSMPETMHGPIGLKVSLFFARHSVRSLRLPAALADVVAKRIAGDAVERLRLRNVLLPPADDRDQLAFEIHRPARIARDDDVLAAADERIVRAVADVGLRSGTL